MKATSKDPQQEYSSYQSFELDTKPFKHAELRADGTLYLEMRTSPAPMFAVEFIEGLRSEIGVTETERVLGDAAFQVNRQIAVRLLLGK